MIKSYSFELMQTQMYVVSDKTQAVVIDPFYDEDVLLSLCLMEQVYIILTHEHFDHISGVNAFKERLKDNNVTVICSDKCNDIMSTDRNNTARFPLLFLNDRNLYRHVKETYSLPYKCSADVTFTGRYTLNAADHNFEIIEMPGHSPGSSIVVMDNSVIFAGDNILGNKNEISFPDSDKEYYKHTILPFLEGLCGQNMIVYPGHYSPAPLEDFLTIIRSYF